MKKRQKIRKGLIIFSFLLFPATFFYLSPYKIIEATIEGIINGSFIFFIVQFLSSLFFGRGFCGWVCPGAGCQEALFQVNDKMIKKGDFVKWIIWIPWICAIIIIAAMKGGYTKIEPLYQTKFGLSITNVYTLIAYLIVVLLIALPSLIAGRRSFCHFICWMAPFMILGRKLRNIFKWPALQLSAESEKCKHCKTCETNCPMSLPVEQMVIQNCMEKAECILCGTCIDNCREGVIKFSI